MHKLLTAFAAASALALSATAAQAECPGSHNVTASMAPSQEAVSMSTYDGALAPPAVEEEAKVADAAAAQACADGEKECAAGTE